jgi:hypothetical protein
MSSGIAGPAVETCEIVWWSGYVKGRFQAYTSPASRAPVLIAESPAIRWRSSDPPGPTETAVHALEELTSRLAEEGWVVAERTGNTWYGLLLTRPSSRSAPLPVIHEREAFVDDEEEVAEEDRLESALLAELQRELREAREEAERERRRRIEVESGLRLVEAAPKAEPGSEPASPRPRFVYPAYVVAVAVAAVIFLVGFGSPYASLVAALTTAAVALALDSWLVARRAKSRAA